MSERVDEHKRNQRLCLGVYIRPSEGGSQVVLLTRPWFWVMFFLLGLLVLVVVQIAMGTGGGGTPC